MTQDAEPKDQPTTPVDLRKKFASLYGTFGTDPVLAEKGIIVVYPLANGSEVEFKIKKAGARNQTWKTLYTKIMKPHAEAIEKETLTEIEHGKLLSELYARSVVIGWNGVYDASGNAVPFTIENCMELMQFMPEILSKIIADSHDRSNFREEQMDATAKNS
jgi:hypothetical protein